MYGDQDWECIGLNEVDVRDGYENDNSYDKTKTELKEFFRFRWKSKSKVEVGVKRNLEKVWWLKELILWNNEKD